MILYHTFSRLADGYDETFYSDGLVRHTIDSEILPLCRLDEPCQGFKELAAHAYTYKVIEPIERRAVFGFASTHHDGRRSKKYRHALILDEDYDRILKNPYELLTDYNLSGFHNMLNEKQSEVLINALLHTIENDGRLYVWFPFDQNLEAYSDAACMYFIQTMIKLPSCIRTFIGFRSFSTSLQRSNNINLIAMQPGTDNQIENLRANETALQLLQNGLIHVYGSFKNESNPWSNLLVKWNQIPSQIDDFLSALQKSFKRDIKENPVKCLRTLLWIYKNINKNPRKIWTFEDATLALDAFVMYGESTYIKIKTTEMLMKLFSLLHQDLEQSVNFLEVIAPHSESLFTIERFHIYLSFLLKRLIQVRKDKVSYFLYTLTYEFDSREAVLDMLYQGENWDLCQVYFDYLSEKCTLDRSYESAIHDLMQAFTTKACVPIEKVFSAKFIEVFASKMNETNELKKWVVYFETWCSYFDHSIYKGMCHEFKRIFNSALDENFESDELVIEHFSWIERAAEIRVCFENAKKIIQYAVNFDHGYTKPFWRNMSSSDYRKARQIIIKALPSELWRLSKDEYMIYLMTSYDYEKRVLSLRSVLNQLVNDYTYTNSEDVRIHLRYLFQLLDKLEKVDSHLFELFPKELDGILVENRHFRKKFKRDKVLRKVFQKTNRKLYSTERWVVLSLMILILTGMYIGILFMIFTTVLGG